MLLRRTPRASELRSVLAFKQRVVPSVQSISLCCTKVSSVPNVRPTSARASDASNQQHNRRQDVNACASWLTTLATRLSSDSDS